MGVLAVDGAADGLSSAEDLLDGTGEVLGEGLEAHLAGDLDNLVEGDVTTVLDVLLLLAVMGGLLERLDDERRSRGDDRDGSLTVLDGKLNSDTETLPVTSGLGNVFTDLLGGKTKRTDLGGKSRGGTNLTTGGSEVDDLIESESKCEGRWGNCQFAILVDAIRMLKHAGSAWIIDVSKLHRVVLCRVYSGVGCPLCLSAVVLSKTG